MHILVVLRHTCLCCTNITHYVVLGIKFSTSGLQSRCFTNEFFPEPLHVFLSVFSLNHLLIKKKLQSVSLYFHNIFMLKFSLYCFSVTGVQCPLYWDWEFSCLPLNFLIQFKNFLCFLFSEASLKNSFIWSLLRFWANNILVWNFCIMWVVLHHP